MLKKEEAVETVEIARVVCAGDAENSHKPVTIDLPAGVIVPCPVCGRRYRRSEAGSTYSPASWPRRG